MNEPSLGVAEQGSRFSSGFDATGFANSMLNMTSNQVSNHLYDLGNHNIILRVDCVDRKCADAILTDVPPENVRALAEAALESCKEDRHNHSK